MKSMPRFISNNRKEFVLDVNRLNYLDALKGFLILLVVWGHAVQNVSSDFFATVTFRTVYCFHMAVFFFVSGIVLQIGRHGIESIPNKTARLMIPYLSWYILHAIVLRHMNLTDVVVNVFSPRGGALWFLFTLAQCIVACVLCERIVPRHLHGWWMILSGIMLVALAFVGRNLPIDVRHFAKYYQYFLGGYLLANWKEFVTPSTHAVINRWKRLLLSLSLFVCGLFCAVVFNMDETLFQLYKVVVAWCGCVGLISLFQIIPCNLIWMSWLVVLGGKTLGIYAVHVFLLANVWRFFPNLPMIFSLAL